MLLNNLKVQERQNRVCTTVAIAIVAETYHPSTLNWKSEKSKSEEMSHPSQPPIPDVFINKLQGYLASEKTSPPMNSQKDYT